MPATHHLPEPNWSGRIRRSIYRPRRVRHWRLSAPPPPTYGWDGPIHEQRGRTITRESASARPSP